MVVVGIRVVVEVFQWQQHSSSSITLELLIIITLVLAVISIEIGSRYSDDSISSDCTVTVRVVIMGQRYERNPL